MVYQAVAEYWANAEESKYDLNVDISLPGRSNLLKYHFLKESHYSTKSDKVGIYSYFQVYVCVSQSWGEILAHFF